jgi:hypothetical protein
LLAGVASRGQAWELAAALRDPDGFGRKHRVPTTPADQEGYEAVGHYWRGSVWSPTNTMVIRGLERYGFQDLAREIALEDLRIVAEVYRNTGTFWENYAPDTAEPGKPAKKDFVGWTGLVPILYFLKYGVGLEVDVPARRLFWRLDSAKRCGCERFRFGKEMLSLVAQPAGDPAGSEEITVQSEGELALVVLRDGKSWGFPVRPGKNKFTLN